MHHGDLRRGHYTAVAKERDSWLLCDDDKVWLQQVIFRVSLSLTDAVAMTNF